MAMAGSSQRRCYSEGGKAAAQREERREGEISLAPNCFWDGVCSKLTPHPPNMVVCELGFGYYGDRGQDNDSDTMTFSTKITIMTFIIDDRGDTMTRLGWPRKN